MPETTVLIIDDELGIAEALTARLEASGYQVYHAANGTAGISAAELHRPDAIILDIRMPDIDGYEVCARIKGTPELSGTPVIFLTAQIVDSARQRAMSAGGCDFLSKPFEAADIIAAIERATKPTSHAEECKHV